MTDMNTQRRPVIGITTYGRDERRQFVLPSEYVDAVRRAGGLPILLPPGEESIDDWLALCDGIVLAGGGDLAPGHYAGMTHDTVYMVDDERDAVELQLARRVLESGHPTLGICRGTQVLNVALGGSLHVHLPDVVGESVLHRLPPREPTSHPIELVAGSRLAALLGRDEFAAASWHHQAIDRVAAGLTVAARAPDGTIEAVELRDHPWLIAVQWHPELTAADDPLQQKLFDALVAASRTPPREE
jgi:putative glutamine amidotransferase